MNYKKILYIFALIFITNCSSEALYMKKINLKLDKEFSNKGFAITYTEDLYDKKIISKKIEERSLIIFQRNLKKNTNVKITNLLNGKSIIARVGSKAVYPTFNNAVISSRIMEDIGVDINEPYIQILSIPKGSMFVAKRAKTFDEEKHVADKAPVDSISIKNLNIKNNQEIKKKKTFSYTIKIADFYFISTANSMSERIKKETPIKKAKIKKLSETNYRVYLGPFDDINSLQNAFNDINILQFENIEILKND